MQGQARLLGLTLTWVVAITWAHQTEQLLPFAFLSVLATLGVLLWVMARWWVSRLHYLYLLAAVALLGFSYTQLRATYRITQTIPSAWIGQTHSVAGVISSMPVRTPFGVRFIFSPTPMQTDAAVQQALTQGTLPSHISTAWYDDDLPDRALQVGQEWRLPLGLKPPRATQNEGVFDQEQLWWADDVRTMATVRLNQTTALADYPQLLATHVGLNSWLENTRMAALQKIDAVLMDDAETAAVFKALSFGEQSQISANQWRLFQQTGITHLISISGVHITMLAALMAWLVNGLWRRSTVLCAYLPSLYAAQWAGLVLALVYALLAGWALPAQRTVYMLALWLALGRIGVAHSGVRVLCLALWGVLMFDPFAVLTIGFWLSFGAVAWLLLAFDWIAEHQVHGRWQQVGFFVATQLAIGAAMLPATLYFFHQASVLGVLINLIAIPLVSAVLVPLMLLTCIVQLLLDWSAPMLYVSQLLAWCIQGLANVLDWLPHAVWLSNLSLSLTLLLTVLALLLVGAVRRSLWPRAGALLGTLFVLALWPRANAPIGYGQVKVHVIDIGQGSAVLLQTSNHNWLYDAGPRYGRDNDAGARVIVPYLRTHDVSHLDAMVLSHNDVDHTGGALSVVQSMALERILTSMPLSAVSALNLPIDKVERCTSSRSFEMDGVRIQLMSPNEQVLNDARLSDNSKSCVLRIDAPTGQWRSMLLTGDIDGLREAQLVVSPIGGVRDWAVDVLMMPHHGSGASSTAPFIEATQAKMAFAQAGYLNPFRHPLPAVLTRYHEAGVTTYETVDSGTLQFCLGCAQVELKQWRLTQPKYWWWRRI